MEKRILIIPGMVALLMFVSMQSFAYHNLAGGPIFVNGEELDKHQGRALLILYGQIPAGNYWYDPSSGLWGEIGGPSLGQILPNMGIGGELDPMASGGGTDVFVNGREIHVRELNRLRELYGEVLPGRYWMDAQLVGGREGEPAIFNLNAATGNQTAGYNQNTAGGGLMSDGSCAGYLHPEGATVLTGKC